MYTENVWATLVYISEEGSYLYLSSDLVKRILLERLPIFQQ
jgi:hypothetical protein